MATTVKGINGVLQAPLWIRDGLKQEAIEFAEEFGKELNNGKLTTTQIRNFFGEVVKLKGSLSQDKFPVSTERSFLMLKPKLAYAVKRHEKISPGITDFQNVIQPAISAVLNGNTEKEKYERFINFADFFEAIIAYHRANGGR
jgi:CRISPR-associated protein Csm2